MAKLIKNRKDRETDELVFESDKVREREDRRRVLIPVAAVAGILVLVVVIALIARGNRKERFVPPEQLSGDYAYTWDIDRKGAVTLSLDHAALPKAQWVVTEPAADAAAEKAVMTVSAGKNSAKSTSVVLTPQMAGLFALTMQLQDGGSADAVLYQYRFLIQVTSEVSGLHALPYAVTAMAQPGRMTGGEGTDYPYAIAYAGASGLQIRMQIPDGTPVEVIPEPAAPAPSGGESAEETAAPAEESSTEAPEETSLTPQEIGSRAEDDLKEMPGEMLTDEGDQEPPSLIYENGTLAPGVTEYSGPMLPPAEEMTEEPTETAPEGTTGEEPGSEESSPDGATQTAPTQEILTTEFDTDLFTDIWMGVSSDEDVAAVSGPFRTPDGEAIVCYVKPGEKAGTCTVTFGNEGKGVKLTMTYTLKEDGSVSVDSHELTAPAK